MRTLWHRLCALFSGPTPEESERRMNEIRTRLIKCEAELAEIKRADASAKIVRLPLRR